MHPSTSLRKAPRSAPEKQYFERDCMRNFEKSIFEKSWPKTIRLFTENRCVSLVPMLALGRGQTLRCFWIFAPPCGSAGYAKHFVKHTPLYGQGGVYLKMFGSAGPSGGGSLRGWIAGESFDWFLSSFFLFFFFFFSPPFPFFFFLLSFFPFLVFRV